MNFLTLGWYSQNSVAKFVKTLLFTFLWTLPGAVPIAVYMAVNDIEGVARLKIEGNGTGIIFVLLTLSFVTAMFGLFRQLIVQYDRDWITLITPKQTVNWNKFLVGAALWGGMVAVLIVIDIIQFPQDYILTFQPIPFFSLLGGALLIIPFQASFEELALRGYIMQQSAFIGKFVLVPLLISSLLFALAHSSNPEVEAYGFPLAMSYYATHGLIFGIAAIMDDGLEISMGAHTGNNIIAFVLTSDKNSVLQTPALFTNIHPSASWTGVAQWILFGVIFLSICSRLYKWGSWSVLWSRIVPPPMPDAEPPAQNTVTLPEQA